MSFKIKLCINVLIIQIFLLNVFSGSVANVVCESSFIASGALAPWIDWEKNACRSSEEEEEGGEQQDDRDLLGTPPASDDDEYIINKPCWLELLENEQRRLGNNENNNENNLENHPDITVLLPEGMSLDDAMRTVIRIERGNKFYGFYRSYQYEINKILWNSIKKGKRLYEESLCLFGNVNANCVVDCSTACICSFSFTTWLGSLFCCGVPILPSALVCLPFFASLGGANVCIKDAIFNNSDNSGTDFQDVTEKFIEKINLRGCEFGVEYFSEEQIQKIINELQSVRRKKRAWLKSKKQYNNRMKFFVREAKRKLFLGEGTLQFFPEEFRLYCGVDFIDELKEVDPTIYRNLKSLYYYWIDDKYIEKLINSQVYFYEYFESYLQRILGDQYNDAEDEEEEGGEQVEESDEENIKELSFDLNNVIRDPVLFYDNDRNKFVLLPDGDIKRVDFINVLNDNISQDFDHVFKDYLGVNTKVKLVEREFSGVNESIDLKDVVEVSRSLDQREPIILSLSDIVFTKPNLAAFFTLCEFWRFFKGKPAANVADINELLNLVDIGAIEKELLDLDVELAEVFSNLQGKTEKQRKEYLEEDNFAALNLIRNA